MTKHHETYGERLQWSFAAVYTALEVPQIAKRTIVVLLVIHTCLLAYSAYVHSPTLDEPGHLVAGLSHWTFGQFGLYHVNPPLVRMVATLPVMAAGYLEDWSGFYGDPSARREMAIGENFVAANGERSFFLFMIARWVCIPFSWIGAIVCYLWARHLYGRPSGVMACAIWCFEPNILAHASLITADAGATALGVAACYTFWCWLKQPTWVKAVLTGVALGLAELAKTTLILFYPLWPLMWLIYRWPDRLDMVARDWLREASILALLMVIGLYVLNLGYGFEGSFTQLKDFHFVSDVFTGSIRPFPAPVGQCGGAFSSEGTRNRFAGTWLGHLPVPLPKNYLLGIDVQQKDFEHYGRPSYLRGELRDHGWWYYYLYAAVIKVPLGLWALGVLALVARLLPHPMRRGGGEGRQSVWLTGNSQRLTTSSLRGEFIPLFQAFAIFSVVSAKTGFSEHMRYVLPAFPFAFIAASQICSRGWLTATQKWVYSTYLDVARRPLAVPLLLPSLISILSCWFFTSSLSVYPHSLSFFNESIGGPRNGSQHLLGSNVDWGQDLKYLCSWATFHQGDRRFYCLPFVTSFYEPGNLCDSFNRGVPADVLSSDISQWHVYQAVSVNCVPGYRFVSPGNTLHREQLLNVLLSQKPPLRDRVGYTIVIY